jgi:signal transduction histidine kinase
VPHRSTRFLDSLAGKITLGYYLIGSAILAVTAMTFAELHSLEHRVVAGEHITRFLNATLETRRFEKNFLLYGQREELNEGLVYLDEAQELLRTHEADFRPVADEPRLAALAEGLTRYRALLAAADAHMGGAHERDLRAAGKQVVTAAEEMAAAERRVMQAAIAASQARLVGSVVVLLVLGIVLARVLSRRVVRPLQQLEENMERLAEGQIHPLRIDSGDREIRSLTAAFNHMLEVLASQQAHLIRSQKLASLGTLLSGVAHELNNPLSNISTSCQILLEETPAENDQAREMLTQIDEQTDRARRIVRNLLEFARERKFQREAVPLLPFVNDTLRLVRGQFPAGISVRVEVEEGLAVMADRHRLQQVFINLLKNAQQAMGAAGEVRVRARAGAVHTHHAIRGCGTGESVEIEIADTGSGIAPDVLPNIFDPFFTTKAVGQGAGLGLSIVHEIIEEHDGCITVESAPGKGTTFFIRLPAAHATAHSETP